MVKVTPCLHTSSLRCTSNPAGNPADETCAATRYVLTPIVLTTHAAAAPAVQSDSMDVADRQPAFLKDKGDAFAAQGNYM